MNHNYLTSLIGSLNESQVGNMQALEKLRRMLSDPDLSRSQRDMLVRTLAKESGRLSQTERNTRKKKY